MNEGKRFEEDFKYSFEGLESRVSLDRLLDPMGGAKGVSNICDFIAYCYPYIYYFELKSLEGNTLNFKSSVSTKQIQGLSKKARTLGTYPGLLVNYRDHEETYFVHINQIAKLLQQEKKSLHINDARRFGVRLEHTKKKTRFKYHVIDFFEGMVETNEHSGT